MNWINSLLVAGVSAPMASYLAAENKPKYDPNSVTPGPLGFLAIFLVILVVVALVIDMVRRIRRTQYRAEVNALLDAEEAAETERKNDPGSAGLDGTVDDGNDGS